MTGFSGIRTRVYQTRVKCAIHLATNATDSSYKQEAFEKCWAHLPLRAVLHCHSPGVATVARRLRIDVYDNDDNDDKNNT